MKPTITLTSDNMSFTDAEDWQAWCDYVIAHVEKACGFEVAVEWWRFGTCNGVAGDLVEHATIEQHTTIREAVARLWEDFCGG